MTSLFSNDKDEQDKAPSKSKQQEVDRLKQKIAEMKISKAQARKESIQ